MHDDNCGSDWFLLCPLYHPLGFPIPTKLPTKMIFVPRGLQDHRSHCLFPPGRNPAKQWQIKSTLSYDLSKVAFFQSFTFPFIFSSLKYVFFIFILWIALTRLSISRLNGIGSAPKRPIKKWQFYSLILFLLMPSFWCFQSPLKHLPTFHTLAHFQIFLQMSRPLMPASASTGLVQLCLAPLHPHRVLLSALQIEQLGAGPCQAKTGVSSAQQYHGKEVGYFMWFHCPEYNFKGAAESVISQIWKSLPI